MRLDLRLRRRSLWACALGFGAYAVLIVLLYPSFRGDRSLDRLAEGNPTMAALFGLSGSLTSPAGWLNANLYANVVPLFALLLSIGYGAAAVAGQNEEEHLGLIAALPVSRTSLMLQKQAALAVVSIPVAGVTYVAVLAGRTVGLRLAVAPLTSASAGVVLLAYDFGVLALALGCLTGSRGLSLGVASALAAASYLMSSLAGVVDWLHDLRHLSPIYWSVGQDQIVKGLAPGSFAALVIAGVLLSSVAVWAFRRLDLR
ncbi:ABC-2 type transport system permease protein [Pedococcus dokdonensis]|uniref:ABC-2 type transport system permease protein n=2 Tax=Pedococcus dokdonensis TaxID=443156 RepID=A0A1H0SHP8_9MICO|nr:ABC-2 type transport system permease protein [Pedococcus dokdonensis]